MNPPASHSRSQASPVPPVAPERAPELFWWHLAWLVCAGAAANLLIGPAGAGAASGVAQLELAAVVIGSIPALIALFAFRAGARPDRPLILGVWFVCSTAAVVLTGGVAGPLAPWCLVPIAAAAAMGGGGLLAMAAACAMASVGLCALSAAVTGAALAPPPVLQDAGASSFWLGLLALTSTASGLGLGLIAEHRRRSRAAPVQELPPDGLEALVSGQPGLLLAIDQDLTIRQAFGAQVLGLEAQEVMGRSVLELADVRQQTDLEARARQALRDGVGEATFSSPGRAGQGLLQMRRAPSGGLAAVLLDAAGEGRRHAELIAARDTAEAQNAGKSRFLANMSHELRTPLNAIMGFSDIMRTRLFGPLPDKYGEYAELIHESGSHLLELINDVLDMSKIEADRFELALEEFDARDAVNAVLRLMRGQADRAEVSLRGVLPRTPLEAKADRRALKQMTLNLVSNALKFTPAGGSVTVSLAAVDGALELSVADTGLGIAPEDLQRLGRPYEQAGDAGHRAAGTGLGLSLVRAFAELHGGRMSIESALGEGTCVTVRLPVLSCAASNDDTPA